LLSPQYGLHQLRVVGGEALCIAKLLYNVTLHWLNDGKSLLELWTGAPPQPLSHVWQACIQVLPTLHGKLDD
jgi:hypothetical protein